MKLSASKVSQFVRQPDPNLRAALIYGPDSGLVREHADALARHVVADLADPFRVVELGAEDVKDDPAGLADEAAAISFTGGRRVVRVRPVGDAHAEAFKRFLETSLGDALIVAEAGELGTRSSLRRLFESADEAVALPCYPDEGFGLRRVIEEVLSGHGLSAEPEAVDFLASALGGDRGVTRSELEKLVTYVGDVGRVSLADAEACVGDSSLITLDRVAAAAASGDLAGLERGLGRAHQEDAAPVALLRAAAGHFLRLHRAAGLVEGGMPPAAAIKALRPPLHFRVAAALRDQLPKWSVARVAAALDILREAEIACKSSGMPAADLCDRALMQVAFAAKRRNRDARIS